MFVEDTVDMLPLKGEKTPMVEAMHRDFMARNGKVLSLSHILTFYAVIGLLLTGFELYCHLCFNLMVIYMLCTDALGVSCFYSFIIQPLS